MCAKYNCLRCGVTNHSFKPADKWHISYLSSSYGCVAQSFLRGKNALLSFPPSAGSQEGIFIHITYEHNHRLTLALISDDFIDPRVLSPPKRPTVEEVQKLLPPTHSLTYPTPTPQSCFVNHHPNRFYDL